MQRVLIETGNDDTPVRCRAYELACFRESTKAGESPVSVSLIHTLTSLEPESLDTYQSISDHACNWLPGVQGVVLYVDLGVSPRMRALKDAAAKQGVPVELRSIDMLLWA